MFLFEAAPWYGYAMWFVVLAALIAANELARVNWRIALLLFVALPVVLTIFVWPSTAGAGSSTGTWFHWVKVYSALAGCLGFLALRFIRGAAQNKWMLLFPPAILTINIIEAVIRDFECYGLNGVYDGVTIIGGPWNIMNGIAGILNILTISGCMGIRISNNRFKDMVWPDMLWFWIIAYDLWNFAYVYNCVGDHAFYAGAALLISCTIPAFFIEKGAWLQARAQTLAFWMMWTMAVPAFVDTSPFAVGSSNNPAALFTVSALALAANVAVFGYHFGKIVRRRINPLREEVHADLAAHREVLEHAGLVPAVPPADERREALPIG